MSVVTGSREYFPGIGKIGFEGRDSGKGADFAAGNLTLEALAAIGAEGGEPKQISGKQELYEALINQHI